MIPVGFCIWLEAEKCSITGLLGDKEVTFVTQVMLVNRGKEPYSEG